MKKLSILASVIFCLSANLGIAYGQSSTGQISGTVTDPSESVVPGAAVKLTDELTKQVRTFTTQSGGTFVFTDLVSGVYTVRVELQGFKAYQQKGISVGAQEHVDLHEIKFQVGDVTTAVEVQSETAHVATDSSDRSVLVSAAIMADTPLAGRDYLGEIRSLPGVAATTTSDRPAWNSTAALINGNFGLQVTLDGVTSQNSGNGPGSTATYLSPNVDAIGEVRVLVGNFAAEYGAHSGGQMVIVMKSGTNNFHGTGYYYWRNEELTANQFFNNKNGVHRPIYRYQNPGGTIGGPVLIPGTRFNKGKNKLFFFFSYDYLHDRIAETTTQFNMPTALERSGNFSQTVTSTGTPITIKDPLNNGVAFPGNMIPAGRISPTGAAMMSLFPLPFTQDPTGQRQYNTIYQWNENQPNHDAILRLDYNFGDKTTAYVRLIQHAQSQSGVGAYGFSGLGQFFTDLNGGWGQNSTYYTVPAKGIAATAVHIFSPHLVNETTFGINHSNQSLGATSPAQFAATNDLPLKGTNGQPISLPNFFSSNVLNFLPNIVFTTENAQSVGQAVTNPPGNTYPNRWPFAASDQLNSFTDNVTWNKGKHNLKFGFQHEWIERNIIVAQNMTTEGTYFFGSDTANPNDTGYPYSNLLLGSVQAYGEDNERLTEHARYFRAQWFAQDSWKVLRRVTVDLGVRFEVIEPIYAQGGTLGLFSASAYNASQAGQLLFPALVNGQKVSINPKSGAAYAYARAGSFDPASYPSNGSPYSGMVEYNSKYFNTSPVQFGPRAGAAWDVFGNGKLAVRGGFGIYYDIPYGVDTIGAGNAGAATGSGPMASPPGFESPIFYNTTFSTLQTTQGWFTPQNVSGGSKKIPMPTVYQWSFGFQMNLGHGTILDAAYVGNVAHHESGATADGAASVFGVSNDINAVRPLTDWTPTGGPKGTPNPIYLDPTSANGGTGGFYNTNLIRSMVGYPYGSINPWDASGESYYDALQVQVNRRMGQRLTFVTNWTWSSFITFTPSQWIPNELTKTQNLTSRPQALNVTFGYAIPDGSRFLGGQGGNSFTRGLTKGLLDRWHVSGVGSLFSGLPMTVSCAAQSAPIGWPSGTPTGGIPLRCEMIGPVWLPAGTAVPATTSKALWYPFNTSSFVLPPGTTLGLGNTPPTLTYGPGFENLDLAVHKQFPVIKEGWLLEVRAEAFNSFNHFNPNNPNTSLTINYQTGANTNAAFGTVTTAANTNRKMVLSLRLRF